MPDRNFRIRLDQAAKAWGTADFAEVLKQELAQFGAGGLPLQQCLSTGNYVADEPVTVVINRVAEMSGIVRVSAGVFFKSVIGGCSCTDDPTPASDINEYCELQFDISRGGEATVVAPEAES
jgi:hypothetical protein